MRASILSASFFLATSSVASAQTLVGNFDAFVEGASGTTLTDGAITVSNLDRAFPGGGPGTFVIDQADAGLTGIAGFTSTNVLGFGGYSPGAQPAFGRCKSFDIQWTGGNASNAQLYVFDFGSYANNTVTLEALSAGNVVASNSFTITAPFVQGHHLLSVAAPSFDALRLVGGGAQDSGVFFAVVDSIQIGIAAPVTGTPECFGDDSLTSCPCANESVVGQDVGCLNSLGLGGRLRSTGVASLAADTVVLDGSQMPNGPALYFQGSTHVLSGAGAPFGDGLRCAGGTVVRLGIKTSVGGASQFPSSGGAPLHTTGVVTVPGVNYYQLWYRDSAAFCTSATFNLTNGLALTWTP